MRQNVRIPLHHMFPRERPMPLRASRIMIIQEGHRFRRPVPNHPRWLAIRVSQSPQLPFHSLLQDAFRGEIKGGGSLTRGVHPVHELLSVAVLVVVHAIVAVVHVGPKLADGEFRFGLADVAAHEVAAVAFREIEPPTVEADLVLHPVHPVNEVGLDDVVGVVDVGGGAEVVASVRGTWDDIGNNE